MHYYCIPYRDFRELDWGYGWLCWGLTSQSTIFQSCRDGAIASWVINQYFRGVKCLAQGHNTAEVGLEPRTSRSGVRHSTTEPPRSRLGLWNVILHEGCTTTLVHDVSMTILMSFLMSWWHFHVSFRQTFWHQRMRGAIPNFSWLKNVVILAQNW